MLRNDLHEVPFGLLEDVFVDPEARGHGIGPELVQAVIEEARAAHCYKLIATSRRERPAVHRMYERLGFRPHGTEFRIDLEVR